MDFSGFCLEYHQNGKVKWVKEFEDRNAIGVWMCFDEKGNFKKQINCKEKTDSLRKIYDTSFSKETDLWELNPNIKDIPISSPRIDSIYTFPDQDARFNGDLKEFIAKNLILPDCYFDICFQGKVYLKFCVETDGSVSNYSVLRGLDDILDKVALDLIKSMPNWIPAKIKGKSVRSWITIPISFTI
jgi:protein TonB